MIRRIINIDKDKCIGCGLCASACHEGAIAMVDGKAQLMREDYCDGLGDCLPTCPTGAITFIEREAPAYNEQAVLASKAAKAAEGDHACHHGAEAGAHHEGGCPGSKMRMLHAEETSSTNEQNHECCHGQGQEGHEGHQCHHDFQDHECCHNQGQSQLAQWPCQIKLVPVNAPFFQNAHLLIAADCTAYAFASMHNTFMKGRVTIIGCPKLDSVDYAEKLSNILSSNDIKDITLVRMEVPCCGGLEMAAMRAIAASGKNIPLKVYTVSLDGHLL